MIRLLLRLPLLLAVGVVLSFTAGFFLTSREGDFLDRAWSDMTAAYPEPRTRAESGARAAEAVREISRRVRLGSRLDAVLREWVAAAALHAQVAYRVLPSMLLLAAAGACAGLFWRERLRNGEGYASPTAAGLGRAAVAAGLLWTGVFALSPIGAPYPSLYCSSFAVALGALVYAANIPLRV